SRVKEQTKPEVRLSIHIPVFSSSAMIGEHQRLLNGVFRLIRKPESQERMIRVACAASTTKHPLPGFMASELITNFRRLRNR
ncbi:MAG: hypothetical protein ACREF9_11005, partial [Opitutaceae bacterium]